MRSWIITALLVIRWPFIVDAALFSSARHLEPRKERETKQEFDQTTASFRQQGLCRFYLGLNRGHKDLEICELKCGDLARKAQGPGKRLFLPFTKGRRPEWKEGREQSSDRGTFTRAKGPSGRKEENNLPTEVLSRGPEARVEGRKRQSSDQGRQEAKRQRGILTSLDDKS